MDSCLPNKISDHCRVCLTKTTNMIGLLSVINETSEAKVYEVLERIMCTEVIT